MTIWCLVSFTSGSYPDQHSEWWNPWDNSGVHCERLKLLKTCDDDVYTIRNTFKIDGLIIPCPFFCPFSSLVLWFNCPIFINFYFEKELMIHITDCSRPGPLLHFQFPKEKVSNAKAVVRSWVCKTIRQAG